MLTKNKKLRLERIFFNQKFLSLLGLIVILLISFPLVKNSLKQYQINREIEGYRKEIGALENKNVDLKNFISYLESDQFAEEQARLNLNLKKPGEELTVIKGGATAASSTGQQIFNIPGYQNQAPAAEISGARKWLNYFFKR